MIESRLVHRARAGIEAAHFDLLLELRRRERVLRGSAFTIGGCARIRGPSCNAATFALLGAAAALRREGSRIDSGLARSRWLVWTPDLNVGRSEEGGAGRVGVVSRVDGRLAPCHVVSDCCWRERRKAVDLRLRALHETAAVEIGLRGVLAENFALARALLFTRDTAAAAGLVRRGHDGAAGLRGSGARDGVRRTSLSLLHDCDGGCQLLSSFLAVLCAGVGCRSL